jgi:hypothetical protein
MKASRVTEFHSGHFKAITQQLGMSQSRPSKWNDTK